MRLLRSVIPLVLILLFVAATGGEAKLEPYKIGAFLSVTGPNAPLGTPEKETLMMLAEEVNSSGGINGHPLELIIEDDESDPSKAVRAAKKLIELDKVSAIIGGSGTGPTMAVVSSVTEAAGVPHISLAAGIDITRPIKKWVFRTPQTDVLAIGKILDYLKKQKIKKVATIYDSNAFGTSGRDQLREQAPKAGFEIVAEEAFNSKDTDMTVQLTRIKRTNAQAVICWGTNPGPAMVARNMKQLNMTIPLLQSHGIANKTFIDLAGDAANGVIFPAGKLIVAEYLPDSDIQKKTLLKYAKDFKAKYGKTADTFGGHAWDAFQIIVRAMRLAGNDKAKLRNEIENNTRLFVGIGGVFSYKPEDHDGLKKDAFVMVKIVDGKWTLLEGVK